MAANFDAYEQWLGIPRSQRPITYYHLLAIELFESDPAAIREAAQVRMAQLRAPARSSDSPDYPRILQELAAARDCLLDPAKKQQYDQKLRGRFSPPAPNDEITTIQAVPEARVPVAKVQEPQLLQRTGQSEPDSEITTIRPAQESPVPVAKVQELQPRAAPPIRRAKVLSDIDSEPTPLAEAEPVASLTGINRPPRKTPKTRPTHAQAVGTIPRASQKSKNTPWLLPVVISAAVAAVGIAVAVPFLISGRGRATQVGQQGFSSTSTTGSVYFRPLRLLPVVDPCVVVGRTYTQQFETEFAADWTGNATYSLSGDVPQGATLDKKQGLFTWTPATEQANNEFKMVVRVSGPGGQTDSRPLTAKVIEPAKVPPKEANSDNLASHRAEGVPVAFVLASRDPSKAGTKMQFRPLLQLGPHPGKTYLKHLAMSPAGEWLAVSNFKEIYIWALRGGQRGPNGQILPLVAEPYRTIFVDKDGFQGLEFSPDGRRLMTTRGDGVVSVLDVASGAEAYRFLINSNLADRQSMQFQSLRSVIFLRNGKTLVSVSGSPTLTQWDAATGERIAMQALSSDQNGLVVSSARDHLIVRHSATFELLDVDTTPWTKKWEANVRREGHTVSVGPLRFSPDSRSLVSGDAFGVMTFWAPDSGRVLFSLPAHTAAGLKKLLYLGNGEVLLSAGLNGDRGQWHVWNTRTMERVATVTAHNGPVRDLAASADGFRFASAGQNDMSVIVWQYERSPEDPILPTAAQRSPTFGQNDQASHKETGLTPRLRPLVDSVVVADRPYKQQVEIETMEKASAAVTFSLEPTAPDGAKIDSKTGLLTWAPARNQVGKRYGIVVRSTAPDGSADSREMFASVIAPYPHMPEDIAEQKIPWERAQLPAITLSVSGADKQADRRRMLIRPQLRLGPIPGNRFSNLVALSPRGSLVAAGVGRRILLWTLKPIQGSDPVAPGLTVVDVKTLLGHRDSAKISMSINAICFTPDEKRMLSAADDGTVRVWDTSSGAELGVLGNHEGSVNDLALLSDGKTLVSLDQSDRIRLWNVDSPLTVGIGQSSRADWKRNAMASQGMRIAATRGSDIVVCRIANRRLQAEHALRHAGSNPNSRVASVCLSPDGQTLAAGGDFGELEFWNVQYGTKISSLTAHPGESVGHLAFLGRGEVLATVGGAGVVGNAYLWDVRTVARLAAIPGHRGPIQGIAPSADGRRFATLGGEDKSIIVWDYDQARE